MKITYKDFKRLDELFSNAFEDFKDKEWAKIEKDFAESTKDFVKLLVEEFKLTPAITKTSIFDVIALPVEQAKKLQEVYNTTKEKMQSSKYAKYYMSQFEIDDMSQFEIDDCCLTNGNKRIEVSFFTRGFQTDLSRRFSEMNIAFNFVK